MKITMRCTGVTERTVGSKDDVVVYDARLSAKPSGGDGLPSPHGDVTLQNVRDGVFKARGEYVVEITPVTT